MYSKLIDLYTFDIKRDQTYPLDGVCYYSNHFEDIGKKRERNPSKWKYFGETIKKWSYHRTEGQDNLNHIEKCRIGEFTQTVSQKNFQSIILILFSNCPHITSSLFRIPEIYVALKEVAKVQVEIADRERIIFTDSLEKSRDVMIAILPSLISSKIKRECNGCFTSHPSQNQTHVSRGSQRRRPYRQNKTCHFTMHIRYDQHGICV